MSGVVDNPDTNDNHDDTEEDDPGATTFQPGAGPGREEMANNFLPGEEQWDGKTILDITDPHRVALVRNYSDIMPETDHWQEPLDNFTDDFVVAQTSVAGQARQQAVSILKAIFGVNDEEEDMGSAILAAFGADEEDD